MTVVDGRVKGIRILTFWHARANRCNPLSKPSTDDFAMQFWRLRHIAMRNGLPPGLSIIRVVMIEEHRKQVCEIINDCNFVTFHRRHLDSQWTR
jgi:hypothetical protein